MTIDITSQVYLDYLVDDTPADQIDVRTPLNNIITILNNDFNGTQAREILRFTQLAADPSPNPPSGQWNLYAKAGGIYWQNDLFSLKVANNPMIAKGDLSTYGAGGNLSRLPFGPNGSVLIPNSSLSLGMAWDALFAQGACFQGRLTLDPANAVPMIDWVGSYATIYLLPYCGRRIALYNGSGWQLYTLGVSGISAAIPAVTDTNYDVFVYDNSGVLTLDLAVWTNDTTRTTALIWQDGVLVKNGTPARRYVGTIRTTGTGAGEDSQSKRYVWNYYNRVERKLKVIESTDSWAYTTGTWRPLNNNSANRVSVVIGVEEDMVSLRHVGFCNTASTTSTVWAAVGISIDGVADSDADLMVGLGSNTTTNVKGSPYAEYRGSPGVGAHYFVAMELGAAGITFYGDNAVPANAQSGMMGYIRA